MIRNITNLLLILANKNILSYTNNYDTNNYDTNNYDTNNYDINNYDTNNIDMDTTNPLNRDCYIIEDNNYFWLNFSSGFISCIVSYILINNLCFKRRRAIDQRPIMAERIDI